MDFPKGQIPENDILKLPRLGKEYRFHIRDAELRSEDWRLGDRSKRFVKQPTHVSFSGDIRSLRIEWNGPSVRRNF